MVSQLVARNVFVLIDFIWQLRVQNLQKYTEFLAKEEQISSSTHCLPNCLIRKQRKTESLTS
jgi:hypothetical protein